MSSSGTACCRSAPARERASAMLPRRRGCAISLLTRARAVNTSQCARASHELPGGRLAASTLVHAPAPARPKARTSYAPAHTVTHPLLICLPFVACPQEHVIRLGPWNLVWWQQRFIYAESGGICHQAVTAEGEPSGQKVRIPFRYTSAIDMLQDNMEARNLNQKQ